jgi:TolB protein
MKKIIALCLFSLCFSSLFASGLYITITGGTVKKAKIAITKLYPLGAVDPSLTKDIQQELRSDLELANLFDFMPESAFAELDKTSDIQRLSYEEWMPKGTSFVLKWNHKVEAGKIFVEAVLYDIPGKKKIFSTRYQHSTNQYYRVVHTLAEDIMKALTGEKGLFLSRLAMVCKDIGVKGKTEIYVMDADGRNVTQVTSDKTLSLSPAWSPDGKTLAYTQHASINHTLKRGIILKSHNLTNGQRKVISAREGLNNGAAWSPKGDKIALTMSYTGKPEIYLIGSNGMGEPEPISRTLQLRRISGEGFQPNFDSLLLDVEPSFSPDGSKLVFSSARSGNPMIYTVDLNTKIANQLTFAGKYNATPDWSPKGDKILFAAQRIAEGNFEIYMIDPDGNNLSRLTFGEKAGRKFNNEGPTWAPTGRHFAYASNEDGAYAIYVMTSDGSTKKRLSPPRKDCSQPSWGPYGG